MYYPQPEEFERLSEKGNLVPVYREILADLETPVSAFIKLGSEDYVYLLESVERGEKLGRYSFLGIHPFMVFKTKGRRAYLQTPEKKEETFRIYDNPLNVLRKILGRFRVVNLPRLPIFFGGAVGYVGYDVVRFFERIPPQGKDDLNFPDSLFIFTSSVVIFDHLDHKIKIVSYGFLNGKSPRGVYREAKDRIEEIISKLSSPLPRSRMTPRKKIIEGDSDKISSMRAATAGTDFSVSSGEEGKNREFKSNFTPEEFMRSVVRTKQYIREGDIFQAVLSQRFHRRVYTSPFHIYRVLRSLNPSPYMYYLKCGDFSIVGSSPEILVRKERDEVILRPIAGTRPRGGNEREDDQFSRDLMQDEKEKAEHIMLVDLGRNDLGRVCKYGTVKVKELFAIEKYSHVMHLVSEVRGLLNKRMDQFDLLRACFPAGTVSGAPKVRAMQIIEELEPSWRGPYAGALGYFSFSGNMDTCIIIRTMIVRDNVAYIQAGAGIVADSDPENEYRETVNKAKALMRAIDIAEEGGEWLL